MSTGRLALWAVASAVGFAAILTLVTALEWDFLHDLGWSATGSSDVSWPSATALGRFGYLQIANFVLLGSGLLALSVALRRTLHARRRVGAWLVALWSVALLLLAFRIDHSEALSKSPTTWNGTVHAVGFAVLIAGSFLSAIVLGIQFGGDERWRGLRWPSIGTAVAALASLVLLGSANGALGFYVFLALILAWVVVVGWRARRLSAGA